jgi:hypothetical protein
MPGCDRARVIFSLLQAFKERIKEVASARDVFAGEIALVHIGTGLRKDLGAIKAETALLLDEIVGRPIKPIDVEKHLGRIEYLVEGLEELEPSVVKRWQAGQAGPEIIEKLDATAVEINRIEERIQGVSVSYGPAEFFGRIARRFKAILKAVFSPALLVTKIVGFVSVITVAGFMALWLTMEKEEDVSLHITVLSAQISARDELTRRLGEEAARLEKTITDMEEKAAERSEKLTLVEYRLKFQEIREAREKLAVEIAMLDKDLREKEAKLSQIRDMNFFMRLFRIRP